MASLSLNSDDDMYVPVHPQLKLDDNSHETDSSEDDTLDTSGSSLSYIRAAIEVTFPNLNQEFLKQTYSSVSQWQQKNPVDPEFQDRDEQFLAEFSSIFYRTPLSRSMMEGNRLPPHSNLVTTCRKIRGPHWMEVLAIEDLGVSAFLLEKVRQERQQCILDCVSQAARERRSLSQDDRAALRASLPKYPRIKLERFNIVSGRIYILPSNVVDVGGAPVDLWDGKHTDTLHARMERELRFAQRVETNLQDLYAQSGL
ncbi:hypothetical protein CC2G_004203 [Coprinopsis cinerea AmutBmut pab1-1]|nr:hypothetical protein CC2G_004203 [Coprinopsis cinerea AmutBmut pab1-1]